MKFTDITKTKKFKLSEIQQQIADVDLLYLLRKEKINLFKLELNTMFSKAVEIDELLRYTNYKPFWWAVEHGNLEFMEYFKTHTTARGKFLLVCHNNYEIIEQLIDLMAQRIEQGKYRREITTDILKSLIGIKPAEIIDSIENLFEKRGGDNQKVVRILRVNLADAINKLKEEQNQELIDYLKETMELKNQPLDTNSELLEPKEQNKKFTITISSSEHKSFCDRVKHSVSFSNNLGSGIQR